MQVRICGIHELPLAIEAFKPQAIVSITDPGEADLELGDLDGAGRAVLRLSLFDVGHGGDSLRGPRASDIGALCAFVGNTWSGPETRMLLHCHAGISRSSAMAAAAKAFAHSRLAGGEVSAEAAAGIREIVEASAPGAILPNMRLLQLAEERLPEWKDLLVPAMRTTYEFDPLDEDEDLSRP